MECNIILLENPSTANVLRIECNGIVKLKKRYFIQVKDIWICGVIITIYGDR